MVALVRGPLVWVAVLVFIAGTIFQVMRFFSLSRKALVCGHGALLQSETQKRKKTLIDHAAELLRKVGFTVLADHPLTITVSTLFHVCLVIVPLFVLGHNELIELALGVSLPSFSEQFSDVLTLVVLLCCAFFLLRRMIIARVRAISTAADYLVLALAGLPFLSGFLAFHQILDYRTVMFVHMLSGEVMLVAIPFTKLTHMIFFFLNRFLIVNEHTLGRGSRVW